LSTSNSELAHHPIVDLDSHYRVRDVGAEYNFNGQVVDDVYQKKLGDRIDICLEFRNATDITMHYNLITHESSIYFIND